jgi:hypothetical protein
MNRQDAKDAKGTKGEEKGTKRTKFAHGQAEQKGILFVPFVLSCSASWRSWRLGG